METKQHTCRPDLGLDTKFQLPTGLVVTKQEIASAEVDPQKTFTPLCPGELPVPDGHLIVEELNKQARYACRRVASKDAHPMNSLWVDTDKAPQLTPIVGYDNLDVRWRLHGVPGTYGFQLLDGLPPVEQYDFIVYKGLELYLHPYGMCYHDLRQTMTTGLIETIRFWKILVVIVSGLATDHCVKATVLQLLHAGFVVILNLGACRGVAPDTTEQAVQEMKDAGAIIIQSADELEGWIVKK